MTPPIPYRVVLKQLLTLWDGRLNAPSLMLRGDLAHAATPVVVRGLTSHAVAAARGALLLYEAKQPAAAMPLVRVVMEDAATAVWLVREPEAWRSFLSEGEQKRAKALREILGRDASPRVAARLATSEQHIQTLAKITDGTIQARMRTIDPAEELYTTYRLASALIHAGPVVVDLYTGIDERSEVGLAFRDHARFPLANEWLGTATEWLLHALNAWDVCQTHHPDEIQLRDIGERLGVWFDVRPALRSED